MTATVKLAYECVGAGPPVVILHGLFGSKRNWQSIARKLAAEFTVFTVDLRNHGDSPHDPVMDYAALSADIGALLEVLGISNVSLVGHSMGGKAAMTYALTDANRLRRLIVVDIAPRAYRNEYATLLAGINNLDLNVIKNRAEADVALEPFVPEDGIRLFLLQNLRIRGGLQAAWQMNLAALDANIDALVGAIPVETTATFSGPSYFIRGENSNRIAVEDFKDIKSHFPDSHDLVIPDAGHWPHAENPLGFVAGLRQILGQADAVKS